ncbi:MAG TPA: hypothetical protein VGM65_09490 [Candidatus Udaeobacter sp.]
MLRRIDYRLDNVLFGGMQVLLAEKRTAQASLHRYRDVRFASDGRVD